MHTYIVAANENIHQNLTCSKNILDLLDVPIPIILYFGEAGNEIFF